MRRAEFTVTALGQDWKMVLDMNAICDLGQVTGRNGFEVLMGLEGSPETGGIPDPSDLRAVCWAMLQEHHPEVNLRHAGRILGDAAEALMAALRSSMPEAEAPLEEGAGKTQAGAAAA